MVGRICIMSLGLKGTDSQVNASLQNQNLRWVQSRLASSRESQTLYRWFCDQLLPTWVEWPSGKRASTCTRIWARPKSSQVHATGVTSRRFKSTQVGHQTKSNASPFTWIYPHNLGFNRTRQWKAISKGVIQKKNKTKDHLHLKKSIWVASFVWTISCSSDGDMLSYLCSFGY